MSSEPIDSVLAAYEAGQVAFERGRYRQSLQCFEAACQQVEKNSPLEGEVQIWQATAYQALGQQQEAIALCQKLTRHTHYQTRKQAKRLLEILQAPPLSDNMKGLIEFPDTSRLEENSSQKFVGKSSTSSASKSTSSQSQPLDLTQVNTEDNQFLWIALIGIIITIGGLLFFA
ncbi:MAG: tetratricopeptide repeat protein [Microcoleaceae cyanobacterium]